MKLVLVLALALLGAVSARQLHEGTPEREVPAEQGEEEPEEPEPPCPMESESFRMIVPGQGGHTCRYVFVNNCQPFWTAQRLCARCYHGRLASIHNYATNQRLRCTARARTNRGQVWIGGITTLRHRCLHSHWIDHSPWNYSNWASGNPIHASQTCVALCTTGPPEMKLFLVLTLLGAVSSRRLSEGALEQEVSTEQGSSDLEEEPGELEPLGSGENKSFMGRGALGKRLRYSVVIQDQIFYGAMSECSRIFHGHLASIHSNSANEQLRTVARAHTNQGQVWVGGITSSSGGRTFSRWMDDTAWDFSNWARGNPSRSGQTCVALCTAGGHWRSVSCQTRLPFICEY
ncbi:bone marrow proteoglycan-like [Gopherus flavomarginatus]|uniref:bone marrow proteoglycan-like n=1 Tax=Gopherus flavomarginatus TaxID=286002 RepID=UPI0021CC3801|nr:bone marrow proteoglycan-like [Gopherus flavomarginatus]